MSVQVRPRNVSTPGVLSWEHPQGLHPPWPCRTARRGPENTRERESEPIPHSPA